MKLITLFPALLLLVFGAPAMAKTISLKCTPSEWVVETGYKQDGTFKVENKTTDEAVFLNINLSDMRASVDSSLFTVTATPATITLAREVVTARRNLSRRFIIQRDSLEFESLYLATQYVLGVRNDYVGKMKGSCIKSVAPKGNQI